MKISFFKYQGTGNDFVLIDNRNKDIHLSQQQVAYLCNRKFGIGADGLMLLENEKGYDFKMVYYNADGKESTMCGNGGRCITAFAKRLNIIQEQAVFMAIDGAHTATVNKDETVSLSMIKVHKIAIEKNHDAILDTGSPHYVTWVNNIETVDVYKLGKEIRNRKEYQPKGINVNFAQKEDDLIKVRTYERGVEDETLSCGTGVTAVAIASSQYETGNFMKDIKTPGGMLKVSFRKETAHTAKDIFLTGPAIFVYAGMIEMEGC